VKRIQQQDINNLNDIVMELPAFKDLKSNEMIHEVLDLFMKDIYRDIPSEQFDTMDFELNERMQETFFANYGIDKKYSNKLKGYLKKDISYQLEQLFQNKGSRKIFEIFGDIFKNIFRKINFYNVRVYKVPTGTTGFRFEYRLYPLYISDNKNIIEFPEIPIEQSRKYLMELENFTDYTAWPMPTNLVYIQFSIGEEVINNMDTFLDGVRSYGTTFLQGQYQNYRNRFGFYEKINAADAELLTIYFNVEVVKRRNPNWEFNQPVVISSFLPYDSNLQPFAPPGTPQFNEQLKWTQDQNSFLSNMQDLLDDYGKADRASRPEMENLRRRWQMFMKLKVKNTTLYHNYDELVQVIEDRYPLMQADFLYYLSIQDEDNEPIFDFYMTIYATFISSVYGALPNRDPGLNFEWVIDYIDVLFAGLFFEADFLKWYFNPVMDLFIRYFFPIEMEYLNDFVSKIRIKDKWNAVSYEETTRFDILAGKYDQYSIPVDKQRFDIDLHNHDYVEERDIHINTISLLNEDDYDEVDDLPIPTVVPVRKDNTGPNTRIDYIKTTIFNDSSIIPPLPLRASINISDCLKAPITKNYINEVLTKKFIKEN